MRHIAFQAPPATQSLPHRLVGTPSEAIQGDPQIRGPKSLAFFSSGRGQFAPQKSARKGGPRRAPPRHKKRGQFITRFRTKPPEPYFFLTPPVGGHFFRLIWNPEPRPGAAKNSVRQSTVAATRSVSIPGSPEASGLLAASYQNQGRAPET